MSTTKSRVRRSRKYRSCGHYPGGQIRPGDLYIEHTEFPGGDSVYADGAGHPVRMPECRDCAERYGRGHLFAAYLATT
jgi:hypothetical protein